MTAFDFKNPDYQAVYAERAERLDRIRAHPELIPGLCEWYREHPADFIDQWGITSDPRNKAKGLPVEVPFILFPRQRELVEAIVAAIRTGEPLLVEKTRDFGCSWLIMSVGATLCLFESGFVAGYGSSKESKVDQGANPDSLFWKARAFISRLPPEFRGGWDEARHSAHMRLSFPATGSAMTGEAGDQIGRGGRSSVYFIDEAAHLERPQLIEQSLASNTNSRIDVSTPCGRANSFAEKRFSGRVKVVTLRWQEDPRKSPEWYAQQCALLDPITRAQEIDLSYDASVEGILIPAEWVQAAIGAHQKLGIEPSGSRRGALDVADEGRDKCAFVGRHGILIEHAEQWSGKNGDIYRTTAKAMNLCEEHRYPGFDYDADGLGAGCRGDAVDINAKRRETGKGQIEADPFRGSGAVYDPDGSLVEGRLNRDYFQNLKAQSWWALRLRFQATYRAVVEGMPFEPDDIISIDPALSDLTQLTVELSQPTYSVNTVGRIVVDKAPDGTRSPNLADAVMIAYALREGAYFAAPVRAAGAVSTQAMPGFMMAVFAVLSFKDNAAAVVYAGFSPVNQLAAKASTADSFCLIDWDLRELSDDFETWLYGVAERLTELRRTLKAIIPPRIFCDDFEEGFSALMRQRDFPAAAVGEDLPPVEERYAKARPYVVTGLVPVASSALDRTVTFRGARRNFLRELLTQTEEPQGHPLGLAFATAVLIVYRGAEALPGSFSAVDDPEERTADEIRAAARKTAIEKYIADLAAWEARREAAIVEIRAKLNQPFWQPKSLAALAIGPPPVNPNAGITLKYPPA